MPILSSQRLDDDDSFFSDIDNFGKNTAGDAFEDFFNSPPISNVNDPISWWHSIASGDDDPLARMGLDFLSAPGKSYIYLSLLYLIIRYSGINWCWARFLERRPCCDETSSQPLWRVHASSNSFAFLVSGARFHSGIRDHPDLQREVSKVQNHRQFYRTNWRLGLVWCIWYFI